jgi:hypothetical protein
MTQFSALACAEACLGLQNAAEPAVAFFPALARVRSGCLAAARRRSLWGASLTPPQNAMSRCQLVHLQIVPFAALRQSPYRIGLLATQDLFSKYGRVTKCYIKGKSTPFAFVNFEDARDAEEA